MKTLASLAEIYAEYDKWEQRLQRARRRREVAERSVERCYKHLAPTVMVEQVAALLRPHFPQYRLRVLGPFGLCSETAIHAYDERGECVGSVAFRPSGNRLNVVDYRRDSGRFGPNTLGALNGLNHPEVAAPTSVAGLISRGQPLPGGGVALIRQPPPGPYCVVFPGPRPAPGLPNHNTGNRCGTR
ncbi:hypothetical protein H7I87_03055 [Mycobacterium timonense]|uniref:Uncharacterized protein n=1 Tax=Mycobacterium bouchedurhonense TaxID=701041 RepID=A0AAW5SBK2_MYCBC|nr:MULTISPECIES: hypothetical protein [Mycobacterium avium complex (MAC)]MCV6991888.1 hypothetical protein [Mycobacterium bouchedurhonense]MCV6993709.1 hypothetical protein [Mycobacterium timonense]MDV3306911.1 hypothetical protein [Mycobacterium avium subsp. hominissuis]